MDDIFDVLDERTIRLRRFPGSHLSAALTYYPQRLIINYFEKNIKAPTFSLRDGVDLLETLSKMYPQARFTEDPSLIYYQLFRSAYVGNDDPERELNEKVLSELIYNSYRELRSSNSAIRSQHPGLSKLKLTMDMQSIQYIASRVSPCFTVFKKLTSLRSSIQCSTLSKAKLINGPVTIQALDFFYKGELIAVMYDKTELLFALINYDQLLMLCDTISSRFITSLVCEINDRYRYDILPTRRLLTELYKWGDELIHENHMDGYAVIGEYESVVTSVFVTFAGSDILNLGKDYAESVIDSAQEIYDDYRVPTYWTDLLLDILKTIQSPNVLSELFGLRKHWGNPMVDAQKSGRAVQDKLNEQIPVSGSSLINLLASFNRMITLSYINKNGSWPKCEFPNAEKPYPLRMAWEKKINRIQEDHPDHRHEHWANIIFKPNCTLDKYEDQLSLLSDKSVSLPREDLDHLYIRGLKPEEPNGYPQTERRLILEFLRKDQMTVHEILEAIMKREVPISWLANSASMKGTEMKHEKARIFAVLTYHIRQYFSVTEDMIKKHLFPLNPHQTMTMSETELLKKLRGITKQMELTSTSRTLNVMHIVDFSKWNLRMNYTNTCCVFKSIDNFLGTPGLVESSHLIFEDMLNVVQDSFNPPQQSVEETENDTIWRFHLGGWEGQRQKAWTILTSALLADLERRTGIHSTICGQGDNQILLTQFPIPLRYKNANDWIKHDKETVKHVLDDYYKCLENACLDIGLKVKTAESCRSLHYLNYGKRLYFNGVELSMTLKRLSKAMTEANDTFPLTEVKLKTSQGSSFAAGLYSNPSPWPFFISRLCTQLILLEAYQANPLIKNHGIDIVSRLDMDCDHHFLHVLSSIPSSLGGPPQQPYSSFLCRGHPDPLCEDIVLLTMKARGGCQLSRAIIQYVESGSVFSEKDDNSRRAVILSPYSLNLSIPQSARIPINEAVKPALREFCKNSSVSGMLGLDMSTYEQYLFRALSTMTPFNPVVANDIFSRSLAGQRDNFVNGLQHATSLCRLVKDSPSNMLINQVIQLEAEQLQFWAKLVRGIRTLKVDMRFEIKWHFQYADGWRLTSWGVQFEGTTVPHPLELFHCHEAEDDLCEGHLNREEEHLVILRHSDSLHYPTGQDSGVLQLMRSRTGQPYLGSKVSEGVSSKQITCKNPTSSWIDSCKLNVVRRWVSEPGSELDALIQSIIETRTDASIGLLNLATGRPSRLSYSHRAALVATKQSCSITTTSNMMTRVYVSSNRMGVYSAGEYNYHLPFGPSFLTYGSLLCLEAVYDRGRDWATKSRQIYHCHIIGNAVPVVYDGKMDLSIHIPHHPIPKEIPLLHTSVDDLIFDTHKLEMNRGICKDYLQVSLPMCRVAFGTSLLGNLFVREISSKEMISVEISKEYQPRNIPISAGDVSLTGVTGLVRAVAINLLLALPAELVYAESHNSALCGYIGILDHFSNTFWSSLTMPFIQHKLINTLKSLSPIGLGSYNGCNLDTLSGALKSAIAEDTWTLMSSLKVSMKKDFPSPFPLVIPNERAAIYAYARYAELCTWLAFSSHNSPLDDAIIFGRKISQLAHQKYDKFDRLILDVESGFNTMCSKRWVGSHILQIPKIDFLDLADPWIDRLRNSVIDWTSVPSKKVPSLTLGKVETLLNYPISIGPEKGLITTPTCNCAEIGKGQSGSLDTFYLRYGRGSIMNHLPLMSLSHFEILLGDTIVLGDESGEVGAVIAGSEHCNSIYIAGCKDVTQYDPHMAGSYVPSEFVGSPLSSKLIHASRASVTGDPLLADQSLASCMSHLKGVDFSGIIVFLENQTQSGSHKVGDLRINRLMTLIQRTPSLKWCHVVLRNFCSSQVLSSLTQLGQTFSQIHVVKSPLIAPCTNVIGLLATKRVPSQYMADTSSVLFAEKSNDVLMRFLRTSDNSTTPSLALRRASIQRQSVELLACMRSNWDMYCGSYISGWNPDPRLMDDVKGLSSELSLMEDLFKRAYYATIEVKKTVTHLEQMPRKKIIVINPRVALNRQTDMLFKWVRAAILKDIIRDHPSTLEALLVHVEQELGRSHVYQYRDVREEVTLNYSDFFSDFCRSLIGILGHALKISKSGGMNNPLKLIHFSRKEDLERQPFCFPIKLCLNSHPEEEEDLSYYWPKRAQIMCILMTILISNCSLRVSRNMGTLYEELSRKIRYGDRSDTRILVWSDTMQEVKKDISELIFGSGTDWPIFVSCLSTNTPDLLSNFNIGGVFKIPWSGTVPDRALFELTGWSSIEQDGPSAFVRTGTTKDIMYTNMMSSCPCYDCSTEEFILNKLELNETDIADLIGSWSNESIYDIVHEV